MSTLHDLIERLGRAETLDRVAQPLSVTIGRAVRRRTVRNLLSGTYVGHPLHPMLTDVPIGAWGASTILDMVGGRSAQRAADLMVAAGVLAAVPTAATGLNDWSDTYGADLRVGVVHATINSTALALYVASLTARARGHRTRGKIIGLTGLATLLAGSYLGGHLTFARGVNVNRTAWQDGPVDWTPVLPAEALPEGDHGVVTAAGVPILLYRNAGRVWALANTCSHMGGPLNEGAIGEGCVTCPWHGSVFRFADGEVVRGPASSSQPLFEARVTGDQIEVRAAT
jgi:nitrite reductase/ring-hydroxylating ferredoxin subunit/uncharacterized membrane protein